MCVDYIKSLSQIHNCILREQPTLLTIVSNILVLAEMHGTCN